MSIPTFSHNLHTLLCPGDAKPGLASVESPRLLLLSVHNKGGLKAGTTSGGSILAGIVCLL